MRWGLYGIIFISKVIELALSTLRLIVVANGKKGLGAILQLMIALAWVLVTGMVVVNITEDPWKIVFFALGSFVGSYVGSIMEEKMALGSNMLLCIVDKQLGPEIIARLRKKDLSVTVLEGTGKDQLRNILMIMVPRKKRHDVVSMLKQIDPSIMVVSETARTVCDGSVSNVKGVHHP